MRYVAAAHNHPLARAPRIRWRVYKRYAGAGANVVVSVALAPVMSMAALSAARTARMLRILARRCDDDDTSCCAARQRC